MILALLFIAAALHETAAADCQDAKMFAQMCPLLKSKGQCTNVTTRLLMQKECPKTCGFCGGSGGAGGSSGPLPMVPVPMPATTAAPVVVTPAGQTQNAAQCQNDANDCQAYADAGYCTDPQYAGAVQSRCPLSCGICSSLNGVCEDVYGNCAQMINYCNYGPYISVMTKGCAKTCGTCGGCQDVNVTKCAEYYSYCGLPEYRASLEQLCRATCGFC